MTEIIIRQTAQEMCDHRDEALRLLSEALKLLSVAQDHATKATSAPGRYWVTHALRNLHLDEKGIDQVLKVGTKRLDADTWRSLYIRTGLGDNFDTEERRKFEEQLATNPIPVTVENVVATCLNMAGMQGEIFTRSIHNLFKRLSRSHKSNNGFCFGDRLIFWNVVNSFCNRWEDTVRDLERAVLTISGETVPDRVNGVISKFKLAQKEAREGDAWGPSSGTLKTKHFDFRWFLNGNLHVRIKDRSVIEKLNRIIADENVLNKSPK